jgi:hypothetical protein
MSWPKVVTIRGIGIVTDSWDEVQEVVTRFGSQTTVTSVRQDDYQTVRDDLGPPPRVLPSKADLVLLSRFVEAGMKGLTRSEVVAALGEMPFKPALHSWGRRCLPLVGHVMIVFDVVRDVKGQRQRIRLNPQVLSEARQVLATS